MHDTIIHPTRRQALCGISAAALVGLGGCGVKPADIVRFGLKVDVQTPQGDRSGFGVVESNVSSGIIFSGGGGLEYRLVGEAIAIELPGNQTLFALIRGRLGTDGGTFFANLVRRAVQAGAKPVPPLPAAFGPGEWQQERQTLRAIRPSLVLPASEYPMLGRFRDLSDPASFQLVDPANLTASFGPCFVLRDIVLSVSDQPPTSGIEARLPWLPDVYSRVDGRTFRPNEIPGGDFRGLFTTKDFS